MNEAKEKLEVLKHDLFTLEMKERWDNIDIQEARRLRNEIDELSTRIAKGDFDD